MREAAVAGGMITLGEDGLAKVKSGITTPEELLRVVTEVREMRTLCSGCGSAVGVDFNACPQCGKRLGGGCPHCGRALQPGLELLSLLRANAPRLKERAAEAAARSASTARAAASCRRPTSRNSRSRAGGRQRLLRSCSRSLAAASADEIKRAFRQQIARYHPDKVQHLGKEFQALAADTRRRADRGVSHPVQRGTPRGVRPAYRRDRRRRARRSCRQRQAASGARQAETEPDAAPEPSAPSMPRAPVHA